MSLSYRHTLAYFLNVQFSLTKNPGMNNEDVVTQSPYFHLIIV